MEKKHKKLGRKPKDGVVRETLVCFKISDEELERIIKLSKYMEIPKTVLVRNMVLNSLDELELIKKVGILGLTKNILKTSEFLKKLKEIKKENLKDLEKA